MKYRVEVGSHVTRCVTRKIIVNAKDQDEASQKAIDKYWKEESKLMSSVDVGEPRIDFIETMPS